MPRLFDAYIMVDWSAAAKPVSGANSIWIGGLARDARQKFKFISMNPKTRLEARSNIRDMAERLIKRGDRVLIGFDFALGYPAGTAEMAGLGKGETAPWQAMHEHLARKVKEKDDNSNGRFALAAGLNYAMSQGPHPFWGAPKRDVAATLSPKKGDFSAADSLPEHRLCETWIKAHFKAAPKSVWQLLGAGAVGSQALLGIPAVYELRTKIEGARLWPFETGFQDLNEDTLDGVKCVLAEVYPSTLEAAPKPGEILDQTQVRMLCECFESLDSTGKLGPAFAPPEGLETAEIHKIEREEGWILAKNG